MDLSGQAVWITGASSGIGLALAKAFAAKGAPLILSGRRVDALEEVAASIETDTLVLPFETTDYAALPSIVETATGWTHPLAVLVNNAGISQRCLAVEADPSVYHDIIAVDLTAPIHLTQLALPHLVARAKAGDYAAIVGISSIAGRLGVPLRTAYCAAKHGLIGYLDALRAETEAAYGLKVHSVLPGSIKTQVSANALSGDGSKFGETDSAIANGMDPDECARRILAGMEDGTPEIMVAEGQELGLAQMRHTAPEQLFSLAGAMGAQFAAQLEASQGDA